MPTITIHHKDLEALLGRSAPVEEIEPWLSWVKGELKGHMPSTGELRIELQDSNRPDLWCVEGIARQIRTKLEGVSARYTFATSKQRPKRRLTVSSGLEHVRPYIAACAVVGHEVTEYGLVQLVQTQEKLADIYGRTRRTVSIGLYRLQPIAFPVTYGLVKPHEVRFTPLGFEDKMTLKEILDIHPKGLEFGAILAGCDRLPLLWDNEGQVLSFPPIINSREMGEVHPGDTEILVEVTGTDLRMVLLTLNILASNLADRGATIEPLEVTYPETTEFGKTFRTPIDINQTQRIPMSTIESALGIPLGSNAIQQALTTYGYDVKASRHQLRVRLPAYRNDLLHAVDVAEDVAISRGYETFIPVMPTQFTVGCLSKLEQLSDKIRDLMVGFGFQEMFSNIMASREDVVDRMRLTGHEKGHTVEVDNVMSQNFSCLRSGIIPPLLRVETASLRAFYPHRLFEVGEVAVKDPQEETGSKTLSLLGALIAHSTASFSEIHAVLDLLFYYLVCPYSLQPTSHPSFLGGRAGSIIYQDQPIGIIGELHPEVLETWQVNMPVSVFELEVNALLA